MITFTQVVKDHDKTVQTITSALTTELKDQADAGNFSNCEALARSLQDVAESQASFERANARIVAIELNTRNGGEAR